MNIKGLFLAVAALPLAVFATDLTGTWKSEFDSQIGQQKYTFTFKQDGSSLTGRANSEAGERKREAELKEGKVEGDKVSFVEMLNFQENEIRISYAGKVSAGGNEIKFTREVGEFAREEIVAKREAGGATTTAAAPKPIRIKAGQATPYTDSNGNVWLPEEGFEGGSTTDHEATTQIAGTKDSGLFLSEHYSMDSFSYKVPNGRYLAKLYFAETYDGITGLGERVFSFNVQGHEFKDFDVWAKAGGHSRAYVEKVPVEVTNGQFRITFTAQVENPQINAIEIIPEGAVDNSIAISAPVPVAADQAAASSAPAASAVTAPTPTVSAGPAVLQIDAGKISGTVSPDFFGLMTEEINYSYEGGLYGELIRNRSFKADAIFPSVKADTYEVGKYLPVTYRPDTKPRFWTAVGAAAIVLDTANPLNEFLNVSLKLDATSASAAAPAGIANGGYWGIPVKPKTTYAVSFYAKAAPGFNGPITVSLESADGKTSFASSEIKGLTGEWKKFEAKFKTRNVPASKENVFKLTTKTPGTIWLQNVSLFPPTYKNRENGNRADLMELLAAMKPKFLRFPGGNYVEGNAFNQRFNWKETIGQVEQRPGHPSCWGYWSTDGLGLLEFAEWCEDLNMEPVLAVFAGYCLGQGGRVEAGPKLAPYVQEALEEIEYLTGDAKTTKWGTRRAQDGHPKPFPLRYVEVGNEDFFDRSGSYEGRFTQFYDAIKAKYPHLKVISSIGHEQRENLRVKGRLPDLVDEHFYRNQQDMEANFHQYDKRSRAAGQSKVFVGEWATRVGSPTPNMAGALGDAAWMCGMERNSDVVLMECFAPLFVNVSQLTGNGRSMQWESDLIGYDALNSYGSPSYHVETMFAQNCGTDILPVEATGIPVIEQTPPAGRRGGTPAPRRVSALYYSATRDAKSGVIFLKIVNVDGSAQRVNVQLSGVSKIASKGQAVVLAASSPSDTNSINDRDNLAPRSEKVTGLSANFTRDFPPYSITVLKLETK